MATSNDKRSAIAMRSFLLRYMEVHDAEIRAMHAELDQLQTILGDATIRLTSSFEKIRVHTASSRGPAARNCRDSGKPFAGREFKPSDEDPGSSAVLVESIDSSFNEAMMALQFDDMVLQIINHARRRIELLARMSGQLEQLPHATIEELDDVLSSACAIRGHNPVRYASIAAGAVELF